MKKFIFLMFLFSFFNLKAQLLSVGGLYQFRNGYVAKNGVGIDINGSTSKYEISAGYLRFNEAKINENHIYFKGDYHLWNYHHAYGFRVKRWTPYIGFTLNHRSKTENFSDSITDNNEISAKVRTGLKISFCSFIFNADYQFGNGGIVNAKLSYVLFVGNKCSKKYIRECNPIDWSQF